VHDIPPAPEEDFMPPINSFTYRVLFYYSAYRTSEEFWKNEGKYQSKTWEKFIGPGPIVKAAVNGITAPTDTPDQKLRKIYAAVMQLGPGSAAPTINSPSSSSPWSGPPV
jgi:hypothetical protein